ncbi:MAG: replicative DNA helicase [Clostridia bacterium]|nr:replicative DNA helicase [Clostridia bacterium]
MEQQPQQTIERALPNSLEAERSVLGAMLLDKEALDAMIEQLRPEDFYLAAHNAIFSAMRDTRLNGDAVDLVTLNNALERSGKLEAAGGIVYLTELMNFVPTAANVSYYASIVEEHAMQRSLIRVGNDMIRDGMNDQKPVDESLNEAERRIYDISMRKSEDSLASAKEIVPETMNQIGELISRKGKLTGIATGFKELDRLTNGLQKSDLIILAARPAMGKSAFAMNIGQYAAIYDSKSVAVFSLEMSKEQLMMRILCTEGDVDSQKIKDGTLDEAETQRLVEAAAKIQNTKFFIDDTPGATVAGIRSKCRRLKAQQGLDLVIIDYMQLIQGTGMGQRRSDNRVQEVSDMTRALKLLSRELQVPIVLLAQLNRGPEQRQDHRPMISDLRESGSIEQDADMVILLYRPVVYDPSAGNEAEAIVAKNRHGPIETISLYFEGKYTRFRTMLADGQTP